MEQRRIDLMLHRDGREHGYTMCEDAQGNFTRGPETVGTHSRVDIDVSCPAGYRPTGLFHTHPNGTTAPSPADIRAARKHKIPQLCIGVPETGDVVCHEVCLKCKQ